MNTIFLKRTLSILVLISALNGGDLKVNILNGTTDSPGEADRVALMDLSKGMVEVSSANNVKGSVTFSDIAPIGQTQYLIQAYLDGVTYSTTIVPAINLSSWDATITVYESQADTSNIKASVPFFVIYAFEDKIYVQKRLVLENHSDPAVTFMKSPGVIKVFVPDNVSEMDYVTFKNGTMPLRTQPVDTENGQVISNPLKPGKSEIDIAYYLPFESSPVTISEIVNYDIDHYHIYVMPMDMRITAPGLSREGRDNEKGLAIYSIDKIKAGTRIDFQLSGTGMSETDTHQAQNTGNIVVEHRLPLSSKLILGGVLVLIILIALFVSITQQDTDLKQTSINMLRKQKQTMLKEYSDLKTADTNNAEREKLLQRLISVYKTLDRIE